MILYTVVLTGTVVIIHHDDASDSFPFFHCFIFLSFLPLGKCRRLPTKHGFKIDRVDPIANIIVRIIR